MQDYSTVILKGHVVSVPTEALWAPAEVFKFCIDPSDGLGLAGYNM